MGQKLVSEFERTNNSPGPGAYEDTARRIKKAAPNYGFGSSKRSDFQKTSITPGPGEYLLPRKIGNAPNYTLKERSEEHKFV